MSKLTFGFKNGNLGTNVSKITSYTIEGLVLDGTFDTATGICSTKDVTAEPLVIDLTDTPVVANEKTNPLIVFPQQPAGNSVTMKIHDSENQNYTCELKFGENGLVAGNNYLFTITVKKTSLEVNSTITDWQTEENDESVAKSDDTDDEAEEPEVPEAED